MNREAIDERTCAEWRSAYRDGKLSTELAEDVQWSKSAILYHLRGDCSHENGTEPVTMASSALSEGACRRIRRKADQGNNPSELAKEMDLSFDAVVAHALGECDHSNTAPTLTRDEFYDRMPVSRRDCAEIRARVKDTETVETVANELPWAYPTVLRHANGDCNHENVGVDPKKKDERSDWIDQKRCAKLRQEFFSSTEKTITELAAEFNTSATTVEKHIKFECTHPPNESIQSFVESAGLDDYIEEEIGAETFNDEFDEMLEGIDPTVSETGDEQSSTENESRVNEEDRSNSTGRKASQTAASAETNDERPTESMRQQDSSGGFDPSELRTKTFVITGSVPGWTRKDLRGAIEHTGGNTTESVSSNTDYLIVGDDPGARKQEDAAKHNVPKLDADVFVQRVSGELPLCHEIDSLLISFAQVAVQRNDWGSLDELVTDALRALFKKDLDGNTPEFTPAQRNETTRVYLSIDDTVRQFLEVYASDEDATSVASIIETALREELELPTAENTSIELSPDVSALVIWFVESSEEYETTNECVKSLLLSELEPGADN